MDFICAEMQGILYFRQAGEKPWKMQPFIKLILTIIIIIHCLLYSTDMEVYPTIFRI